MKIKWNWGTGIFIVIIVFIVLVFLLVYNSTLHPIDLVEKDYYPKGLKYQDRIDEINNALPLKEEFVVKQNTDFIVLNFPEIYPDSGTVYFFRPSAIQYDRTYPMQTDSQWRMEFPAADFITGKYVLKIQWSDKGDSYYVEKSFYKK